MNLKKLKKNIIIASVSVVVLIVLIIAGYFIYGAVSTSLKEKKAEDYIKDGNYLEAYKIYCQMGSDKKYDIQKYVMGNTTENLFFGLGFSANGASKGLHTGSGAGRLGGNFSVVPNVPGALGIYNGSTCQCRIICTNRNLIPLGLVTIVINGFKSTATIERIIADARHAIRDRDTGKIRTRRER